MLAPSIGKDSSVRSSELVNAVSPSEAPPTLGAITSQRINIKDPKAGTRPDKRSWRVRGNGKGKGRGKVAEALQEDMENVPPPAIRQNAHPRRRRARGSGRVDIGIGPAPGRGRVTNSVGGGETVQTVNNVTGRSAEGNVKTVDVDVNSRNKARKHGRKPSDTNIGAKRQDLWRLPSQETTKRKNFESGQDAAASLENVEIPKADRLDHVNAADRRPSEEKFRRSAVPALLPTNTEDNATASSSSSPRGGEEAAGLPRPTVEHDTSSLQPLPSSTRRRAKEYFQRRTRERSVDATRRHVRPARRSATVTGQGRPSNVLGPRSELDQIEGAVAKASGKASGKSATLSDEKPDHFAFDPVTSPFTPNATSSPKQASPSYIAVRSFSSPTPLPSHGNGKVAPLMLLPKSSNRNTQLATRVDSIPPSVPTTSHGLQGGLGLVYTYAGGDPAQAQLEAEQIALMRLQAYYNWLAGSTPITAVGIGLSACEHMEMSGGGGGLSGGVALGRQGQSQSQGRGKGQCRNSSGAYAHPKEHVVFSPGDHEQVEVASRSVMQPDGRQGQTALIETGKDEARKEPEEGEGEARRTVPKWNGNWGLREPAASGKEIGWNWGTIGR